MTHELGRNQRRLASIEPQIERGMEIANRRLLIAVAGNRHRLEDVLHDGPGYEKDRAEMERERC